MAMVLESAGLGSRVGESAIFSITQVFVWILVLPVTSYVIWGKLLNL